MSFIGAVPSSAIFGNLGTKLLHKLGVLDGFFTPCGGRVHVIESALESTNVWLGVYMAGKRTVSMIGTTSPLRKTWRMR